MNEEDLTLDFFQETFFQKFELLNSGCGLSVGATYLQVFTVFPLKFLQCDGAGWWLLAGLVSAHRVTQGTSMLSLIVLHNPRQPLMEPISKLIYW